MSDDELRLSGGPRTSLSAPGATVLVVEDEESGQMLELCRKRGFNAHSSRSVEEALIAGSQLADRLSGVLFSLSRPGETVLALAHLLGDGRLRNVPVVVAVPAGATALAMQLRQMGALICQREALDERSFEGLIEEARQRRVSIPPNRALGRLVQAARSYAVAEPETKLEHSALEASWGTLLRRASFRIRTPAQAQALAGALSSLCPDPVRRMLGFEELLLNAIEHGNLGIDGRTKQRLLMEGTWALDVERLLAQPQQRDKYVSVDYARGAGEMTFTIRDQGPGFDWRKVMHGGIEADPTAPNGRGIALARQLSFDALEYVDPGNVAIARLRMPGGEPFPGAPASESPPEEESEDSSRQQLEHELLKAHARVDSASDMQRFFDQSGDLMLILEAGIIVRANASFAMLLGHSPEALRGTALVELAHPEDSAQIAREFGQVGLGVTYQSRPFHVRTRCVSGEYLQIEWSGTMTAQGRVFAIGRDVTEIRRAFEELQAKNEAAERTRTMMAAEQVLAGRVLANVRGAGCLDDPAFRYSLSPLDFFNGDIALAARTPSGEMRWILGDFTGHGLGAAVGTIPIASVFYATARKGVPMEDTLRTLNDQLKGLLPPGLFCAAAVMSINPERSVLSLWNGGIPPVVVMSGADASIRRFPSQHLALSILESASIEARFEQIPVAPGDQIFAFSDGLTESANPEGRLFGQEEVERALQQAPPQLRFEAVTEALQRFRGAAHAADDVSLVAYTIGEPAAIADPAAADTGRR